MDPRSAPRSPHVLAGCLGALAILGLAGAFWCSPFVYPQRYLASVERAGAPVVAAIDAYILRVGHPPEQLSDMLPEFDAAKAGTGFPRQDEFFYRTWPERGQSPDDPWVLVVWVEAVALDCDEIRFASTKRKWEFVRVR